MGAPGPRCLRGIVESLQQFWVRTGRGQRQMACLELRLRDDAGQRSMNLTAPRRCRIGVDAMGDQRMAVTNAVAVDHDDTMALDVVEQLCCALDSGARGLRED